MADLTAITAQVAQNTSVIQSAIQLISNLAALIVANKTDPVALQALADQMKSDDAAIAASITANTLQQAAG